MNLNHASTCPKEDLDHIMAHTEGLWEELRGESIFITGGTGFFGRWLLESFAEANRKYALGARVVALSRDPEAFRRKAPHLASDPAIRLHAGDVCSFEFPGGTFSHVIHAATESATHLNEESPLRMLEVAVDGTRRALQFAVQGGARNFLLTSSGAVYGKQPPEMTHMPETFSGAPDLMSPASAYAEGKRVAELLCALYHREYGLNAKIARGFAFVGPHLPLDAHFAIGNFVRDALAGNTLKITGDGTPQRSYLYAADLAVWLWTILLRGQSCHPYNVGSEDAISISGLAEAVCSALNPQAKVVTACTPQRDCPAQRYVPSTKRATTELGLRPTIGLAQSLQRTAAWHARAACDKP